MRALALLSVFVCACQVTLPEDRILCGPAEECPSGFRCVADRCVRGAGDAGVDDTGADIDVPDALVDVFVDAPGDAPDAIIDAGPPLPTASLVFEGSADESVDAMAIDGNDIFIVGESGSGSFGAGAVRSPVGGAVYIAKLTLVGDAIRPQWIHRLRGDMFLKVSDVDVLGTGDSARLVVVGRYRGTFRVNTVDDGSSPDSETHPMIGGYLVTLDAATGEDAIIESFRTNGDLNVSAMATGDGTTCVVGQTPSDITGAIVVDEVTTAGGFLACRDDAGAMVSENFLRGLDPDNGVTDIAIQGTVGRFSWTTLNLGSAGGFNVGSGYMGFSSLDRHATDADARPQKVAFDAERVALFSMVDADMGLGLLDINLDAPPDPVTTGTAAASIPVSAEGLEVRDMRYVADTLHVVGRFDSGLRVGSIMHAGGDDSFHLQWRGDDAQVATGRTNSRSTLDAIGALPDGRLVLAGTVAGRVEYPVALEGDQEVGIGDEDSEVFVVIVGTSS